MLKGIPKIVSPALLKVLCEMGHGDEIVIADGNFPCESMGTRVVRADGSIASRLRAAPSGARGSSAITTASTGTVTRARPSR